MTPTRSMDSAAMRMLTLVAMATCSALRAVPCRWRAPALFGAARLCTPLEPLLIDDYGYLAPLVSRRERVTYEILRLATRMGLPFDPVLTHRDRDVLDTALASGDGVLVLGVHARLNYLAVRHLDDCGADANVVATYTDRPVFGRRHLPRYIGITATTLLSVMRALAQQQVVIALTDRSESGRNAHCVSIGDKAFWVASSLARMAVLSGSRVVFMHPRLARGGVEFAWCAAPYPADLGDVMDALGTFLQAQAQQRLLGARNRPARFAAPASGPDARARTARRQRASPRRTDRS